jgi:hypothetical protein
MDGGFDNSFRLGYEVVNECMIGAFSMDGRGCTRL